MKGLALSQLPKRFVNRQLSATLGHYVGRKYSLLGFAKDKAIDYNPEFTPEYSRSAKYRWVENVTDGLREVGASHDIIRLNHTGWFTNQFQDETVHGVVYLLPHGKYVPAVDDPNNEGCACLDFSSTTDSKEDAAKWADSMAEMWAESEREYQAKEEAAQRIEDINEEMKAEYSAFRNVAREIRANCDRLQGIKVVSQLVREKWEATKETIHKLRKERKRIEQYGIEY